MAASRVKSTALPAAAHQPLAKSGFLATLLLPAGAGAGALPTVCPAFADDGPAPDAAGPPKKARFPLSLAAEPAGVASLPGIPPWIWSRARTCQETLPSVVNLCSDSVVVRHSNWKFGRQTAYTLVVAAHLSDLHVRSMPI